MAVSNERVVQARLDEFYASMFPAGMVVRVERITDREEQRSGRDVRVQLRKPGGTLFDWCIFQTLEEKIRSPERSGYDDTLGSIERVHECRR